MSRYQLPPPTYIGETAQLAALVEELRSESLIALDTESNGLYAYQEQVCLIQLSTRRHDYLIDALSIDDLNPLGELTADPTIEIVFHAAEYDIACMKRDFGFTFVNLFDTFFAARILGIQQVGLAALLEQFFDVELDKRFQRANWGKRPLPREQQSYAQMDTHFLPQLRDILFEKLKAQHALSEAREIFEEFTHVEAQSNGFDEEGYWRIPEARDLSRRQIACLRELYLWREQAAQERDIPSFKVLRGEALVRLVRRNPRTMRDLFRSRTLRSRDARRYGTEILETLEKGRRAQPPSRPRHKRTDPEAQQRHDQLKQWRKERALARGVESDIIVPREALWDIAKHHPQTLDELEQMGSLGPWRTAAYGHEILQVLSKGNSKKQ